MSIKLLGPLALFGLFVIGVAIFGLYNQEEEDSERQRGLLSAQVEDRALAIMQVLDLQFHGIEQLRDQAFCQSIVEQTVAVRPNIVEFNIHAPAPTGRSPVGYWHVASNDPSLIGTPSDPEDIEAIINNEVVTLLYFRHAKSNEDEKQFIDVTSPVHDAGGHAIGTMGITFDLHNDFAVFASMQSVAKQSVIRSGITIALVGLLCLLLSYSVIRRTVLIRVRDLAHAARQVTAGDLRQRLAPGPDDTIGETIMAFNSMVTALAESRSALEQKQVALIKSRHYLRDSIKDLTGTKMELQAKLAELEQAQTATLILMDDSIRARAMAEDVEANLAEAQRLAHIGSWDLDLVNDRLTWSDEVYRLFELDRDTSDVSYKAFLQVVHPDDRAHVGKVYRESVSDRTPYDIVHRLKMPDGRIKYVNERCKTFYDEGGTPIRSLGTVQDLTELRQLEEQFLRAQKMEAIGTLVGGIAHDFNNILSGILGNIYLVKRNVEHMPDVVAKLDNVESLGYRAADMVAQLLTFARRGTVEMKAFSFTTFVKEAFRLAKVSIPEDVRLSLDFCRDSLVIQGDATQLQQVLMNLLINARDAVSGRPEPTIQVKLDPFAPDAAFFKVHADMKGERFVRMSVSDNGCGIARENLDKIFEPFFTTKAEGKGTGLGLAMVYGAIKTHGGAMEVESEADKGTTFHIYLPLHGANGKMLKQEEEVIFRGSGETILLVDDEAQVREAVEGVLVELGYRVLTAADGVEALRVFDEHRDEVALTMTDVVMPNMGGVDLAQRLREIKNDLPLILMTGYDRERLLLSAASMECCRMLNKQLVPHRLSRVIRELLG
ncbi:MAG: ATP-binding protein [Mariprofundaceae bacterium]